MKSARICFFLAYSHLPPSRFVLLCLLKWKKQKKMPQEANPFKDIFFDFQGFAVSHIFVAPIYSSSPNYVIVRVASE